MSHTVPQRALRLSPDPDIALPAPITVEVVLGMPKHDCKFHGICRMEPLPVNPNLKVGCERDDATLVRGTLHPVNGAGGALLRFATGQLNEQAERYHFNRRRLRVWEPLDLADVCPDFSPNQAFVLPGAYQLAIRDGHYYLRLRFGAHVPVPGKALSYA